MAELIRIDKNGTKYWQGLMPCERCGGQGGHDKWNYTGWTCYKCGGSGTIMGKWKEYTPEYKAKLEERRHKRQEKYIKEHEQEIKQREAERIAKEEREKAEAERIAEEERAEKAKSQYFGEIGEKIEEKAVYKFSAWYDTKSFSGFGMQTNYIHTFKIGDNTTIWKTTKPLGLENDTKVLIKGTIKDHNEYREEKQTILTRCKVQEL